MTHGKWLMIVSFMVVLGRTAAAQDEVEVEGARPARVAEPGLDLGRGIRAYGSLSTGVARNLDDPPVRKDANRFRLSDPDHDTFGLTLVKLGLVRDVSGRNEVDIGFRMELAVGRLVEKALASDGLLDDEPIDLPLAYATAQLPTPLGVPVTVRAGRMDAWFGHEELDPALNASYSHGYLSTFGPGSFTGLGVGIDLADGLKYEQFVGNGWDLVHDDNDAKTFGGALSYRTGDLALRGSWILGAERLDVGDQRWALGIDASYVLPIFRTELKAAAMYGEEEDCALGGGTARFGGVSLSVKQGFFATDGFDRLSLALRAECFRDDGGSRSGCDQTLAGVTATLEVRPLEVLALRVEYRHDRSSEAVFGASSSSSSSSFGGDDRQDTISASVSLAF